MELTKALDEKTKLKESLYEEWENLSEELTELDV